jgi:hypothetical protein
MPSRSRNRALLALLLLLAGGVVRADDRVIADFAATRYVNDQIGYLASLVLQEELAHGGVLFGMTDIKVPMGSLYSADVDGYHRWSRYTFSLGGSVGDAETGGTRYSSSTSSILYKMRAGADVRFDAQWSAHVGEQFIHLDNIHGVLLTSHAEYHPTPQWSINPGFGFGTAGNLADRYGELSAHWFGPQHVYAGIVIGRTGYDMENLGAVAVIRQLREEYLGISIPLHGISLNVLLDNLSLDGQARQTLHLGVTRRFGS